MGKLFDSMKQRGATLPLSSSTVVPPRLQVVPTAHELSPVNDHEPMPFYEVPNDQEPARPSSPYMVLAQSLPPPQTVEKPAKPAIIQPVSSKLAFTPSDAADISFNESSSRRLYADELIVIHRPNSPRAQEYRHLAENLIEELTALQANSLTLLPLQQESASTLAANLGCAWADLTRHPLVLIDAARSIPGDDLACYFGLTHAPGWEELMTGSSIGETLQQTGRAWLDLIGTGRRLAWSNTQSWATQASQVLHTLSKHYRHVLLLGPAFPHSPLGLVLAEVTAATCMLTTAHSPASHRDTVQKSLAQAGKPVVGTIVLDT